MKLRKGDTVIVKTGKDAGKTGKVVRVLRADNRLVVEGVNVIKRHKKSRTEKSKSQIVELPAAIHASNVMALDPKSGKATRIGMKKANGKNVRIARTTGNELK